MESVFPLFLLFISYISSLLLKETVTWFTYWCVTPAVILADSHPNSHLFTEFSIFLTCKMGIDWKISAEILNISEIRTFLNIYGVKRPKGENTRYFTAHTRLWQSVVHCVAFKTVLFHALKYCLSVSLITFIKGSLFTHKLFKTNFSLPTNFVKFIIHSVRRLVNNASHAFSKR